MKRSWFRIHLSTAIVLMFVAGALVWMNCSTVRYINFLEWKGMGYGWPAEAIVVHFLRPSEPDNQPVTIYYYWEIANNFAVSGVLLILTAWVLEMFHRRRENRIAPPPPTSNK